MDTFSVKLLCDRISERELSYNMIDVSNYVNLKPGVEIVNYIYSIKVRVVFCKEKKKILVKYFLSQIL